ncbi:hypothetical protein [Nocardia sp. NBC_00511]|uniref:hypothetical protein n=1 Tax=Nocardia sp. NBC_00511 TaxID=2903591 RepID=UPI0030E3819D
MTNHRRIARTALLAFALTAAMSSFAGPASADATPETPATTPIATSCNSSGTPVALLHLLTSGSGCSSNTTEP